MIRPATRDDLIAFYGRVPESMRAIAAVVDGEVLAVAGVSFRDHMLYAFSDMRDEMRPKKKLIVRMSREFRRLLEESAGEVTAVASLNEENAPRLLESIGFRRRGEVFVWAH